VPLHRKVSFGLVSHDRAGCPYAHNFQDFRRNPKMFHYTVFPVLFSPRFVPTGSRARSSPLRRRGVLSDSTARRVMAGSRRSFTLNLGSGSWGRTMWKPMLLIVLSWGKRTQSKNGSVLLYLSANLGGFGHWSAFLQEWREAGTHSQWQHWATNSQGQQA
jgi:hypothetical protein